MKIQVLVDFCICKYLLEVQQELMNITIPSLVGTPNIRDVTPNIWGVTPNIRGFQSKKLVKLNKKVISILMR